MDRVVRAYGLKFLRTFITRRIIVTRVLRKDDVPRFGQVKKLIM